MTVVNTTSAQHRPRQPQPEIFHTALRELGADPGHTWHAGDSLTSEVAGAHNADLAAAGHRVDLRIVVGVVEASRDVDAVVGVHALQSGEAMQSSRQHYPAGRNAA
jgi:FMN phosphatase YigB (HAD superfamily)